MDLEHESFESRSRPKIWDRITNGHTDTQTGPGIELLCISKLETFSPKFDRKGVFPPNTFLASPPHPRMFLAASLMRMFHPFCKDKIHFQCHLPETLGKYIFLELDDQIELNMSIVVLIPKRAVFEICKNIYWIGANKYYCKLILGA